MAPADAHLLNDRYRLGALLGRGSAGRVYEAVDITLGRQVAVKVFQADGNPVGRYRFAAEARLLAGLSHPGLVTVHDVALDHDTPFLVMRLVNGPTLRALLDRGPFEPAAVARIGARLTDVLGYLHARDIVHRDIKPSNVLLDESGACHITDFGIARALDAAHLTVSGEFVGTAAYVAPEQITDVDVGPGADIYSLGLLLLECLTGRTEYTGTTVEAALARLNRPPRVPATLPSPWQTLLTAMTALDPAARPDAARCGEVLTAIAEGRTTDGAVATRLVTPPPATTAVRGRSRLSRPRQVYAGVTALALAAVCAAVVTAPTTTSGRPTGEPRPDTPAPANTEPVAETLPTSRSQPAQPTRPTSQPAQPQPTPPRPPTGVAVTPPAATNHGGPPPVETVTVPGENPGKGNAGRKNQGPGKAGGNDKGNT